MNRPALDWFDVLGVVMWVAMALAIVLAVGMIWPEVGR